MHSIVHGLPKASLGDREGHPCYLTCRRSCFQHGDALPGVACGTSDEHQPAAGSAPLRIDPARRGDRHPRSDALGGSPPGPRRGLALDPDSLDACLRPAWVPSARGGEVDREAEAGPAVPAEIAVAIDRRWLTERRCGVGGDRRVRVDRAECREAHRLNLDEAAVLPLHEARRTLVPRVLGAPGEEGDREQRGDREDQRRGRQSVRRRGRRSGWPAGYIVQALLSARQRRVQRRIGSMTILSMRTITTSITKPHAIIPVKLPASYQ